MVPIGCSETSVQNYHNRLRIFPASVDLNEYLKAPAGRRLDYSHDWAVGEVVAEERRTGLPAEVASPAKGQLMVDQGLS